MSVRKYAGKRSTHWYVILELGTDPATGKRRQQVIRHDPDTGLSILTKKRAQEIERAELVKLRRPGYVAPSTETLGAFLARWLEETRSTRAESTHVLWLSVATHRIVPAIGHVRLCDLTALDLLAFYRGQSERYAASSINTTRTVLSGALKAAVRWRVLDRNPHEGVRLPRGEAPERTVWIPEEARAFLAATANDPLHPLWRLLLDSAMRIGEALALDWRDLDWDAGTVTISKGVAVVADGTRQIVPRTKSDAGRRTLVLAPATLAALRAHRAAQNARRLALGPYWHDTGLIFDAGDGQRLGAWKPQDALKAAIRKAGVPALTLHGLRHTSLTLAVAAGEPLHAVSKRAGHRSITTTADLYAHMSREADQRVSEAISRALDG